MAPGDPPREHIIPDASKTFLSESLPTVSQSTRPDPTLNGIQHPSKKSALFRRRPIQPYSLFRIISDFSSSGDRFIRPVRTLNLIFKADVLKRLPQLVIFHALAGILLSLTIAFGCTLLLLHARIQFPAELYSVRLKFPIYLNLAFPNSSVAATSLQTSQTSVKSYDPVDYQLERLFSIPLALSVRIPYPHRFILFNRLQSTRVRRTKQSPKVFFLHVVGNDAENRCRAIASAITYAKNTDRLLVILWDSAFDGKHVPPNALSYAQTSVHDKPPQDFIFAHVRNLHLAPNVSRWSDFSVSYFTSYSQAQRALDNIMDLATRHIFFRSDSALTGKYTDQLPGVMIMSRTLTPASAFRNQWDAYIRRWTFPHLDTLHIAELLNRVYGVPRIFIDGMSDDKRRLMLRLLDQSKSKRALFVHAQYGLGNRLRALGSAMAIANVTGRVLVLIWEPDAHLDCTFNDLFVNEYVVIEKFVMNWPPVGTAEKDQAMQTVDFYNFMRNEGPGRHNPLKDLVNPRNGRHVYAKSAYVLRSSFTPRIISTRSAYWKIMRDELVPQVEIMSLVLHPMFANIKDMVGVHIRARTIENDIKGIGHDFYGKASETTDHWRQRTGLKTFEDKIRRLSTKYNFFVAADTREAIHALENRFGSHRFLSVPRDDDCVTRDVECAKLALVDILLLSRVSTLLGSHWSSFTEGAVRLSGRVRVLLAGIHFG